MEFSEGDIIFVVEAKGLDQPYGVSRYCVASVPLELTPHTLYIPIHATKIVAGVAEPTVLWLTTPAHEVFTSKPDADALALTYNRLRHGELEGALVSSREVFMTCSTQKQLEVVTNYLTQLYAMTHNGEAPNVLSELYEVKMFDNKEDMVVFLNNSEMQSIIGPLRRAMWTHLNLVESIRVTQIGKKSVGAAQPANSGGPHLRLTDTSGDEPRTGQHSNHSRANAAIAT